MVGVPGKYKGCETCRRRRVKCSNERPACRKCINTGRQCEGYERERVFITGTPATKGRVASHPKKQASGTTLSRREEKQWRRSSSRSEASSPPSVTTSASTAATPTVWEDQVVFNSNGAEISSNFASIRTKLEDVSRDYGYSSGSAPGQPFTMVLPPYETLDMQPAAQSHEFACEAQVLTNYDTHTPHQNDLVDPYCLYLYEHNMGGAPTWMNIEDGTEADLVRGMGPKHFQAFPNHHYFSRIYRPTALSLALVSRKETFLAIPEWTTVPWEHHPKAMMDELLDIALFLPTLLAQSDELMMEPPTTTRRDKATQLLKHCVTVDKQFEQWNRRARGGHAEPYWPQSPAEDSMLPFPNALAFRNAQTGMMFLYYWMSQTICHCCITTVNSLVVAEVIDSDQEPWLTIPNFQPFNDSKYQQTREIGAKICQGLDFVLDSTMQPDLLLGPLRVVTDLYQSFHDISQDAVLEVMWLEVFGEKLRAKAQGMSDILQRQKWYEIARL